MQTMNKIPFVDLKAQYKLIKKQIDKAIRDVFDESAFIGGKFVTEFEERFKNKLGVNHCISCANGTDALFLALKTLGIGKGDEVITTAHSWIATSESITNVGAKVVFADIEEDFFTIDSTDLEKRITNKTKAVIPVHLYGQAANIDEIKRICKKNNLYLIEDCAQAHFAEFKGRKLGTFGDIATFSFYPGKNLGAYGDAGAVITNDNKLAKKVRMLANHGALIKHRHKIEGINSRMDGLQAAILKVKLNSIDKWNSKRMEIADRYIHLLKNLREIKLPKKRERSTHIFHLFVIIAEQRDNLKEFLLSKGIITSIHYPTFLPFLEAYKYLNYSENDFPNLMKIKNKILSLPIYPELEDEAVEYICNTIKEFYG